jgi:hypothetical protein
VTVLLVFVSLGVAGGCGNSVRIDPGVDTGRAALDAALSAWKSGAPVGDVAETKPPVRAVDSNWAAGKKLASFEVGRAEPGAVPPRWSVTLQFEGQASPVETRYVVVGTDPIWVYRESDYLRMLNMDDNPAASRKRGRGR